MFRTIAALAVYIFHLINSPRPRLRERLNHHVLAELHGREAIRYTRLNARVPILRLYMDPEQDMKPSFGLTRRSFNALLATLQQKRNHGWGHNLEVLIFVYWLAHGTSYRMTSEVFDIPKSTIHRVVHKIAGEIRKARSKVIFFPRCVNLDEVGRGFGVLAQHDAFNRAVGAIGGCHIQIKPPERNKTDYLNYKQFYSIQLQAICDSTGKFLDVFVGYGGSVHDTRILKNNPVYVGALYPPPGYFLLGDRGYPCIEGPISIITPYRQPLQGTTEERFNQRHSRARSVIERAFGMMKTRWRATLSKALEVKPRLCSEIALACAVLHNLCLASEDIIEEPELQPHDPDVPVPQEDVQGSCGLYIRDRLTARLSAPSHLEARLQDHNYAL